MPGQKLFRLTVSVSLLVIMSTTALAATVQHHPFTQLFPPDENLGFGGYNVENASEIETEVIRANNSDIIFQKSGGV